MRKLGAFIALGALGAAICSAPPAQAFGLRLGPFHIGLPLPWYHRSHHSLYMRANPDDVNRSEGGQTSASALLYPNLALNAIFQNIFWPGYSSSWPFGYQAIFTTAFAKAPLERNAQLCQPADNAGGAVDRLSQELAPTPDQVKLLQRLGGAMGAASNYLAKSCPTDAPTEPVARLQQMESQVEELSMAVDMIRQPLQDLVQSLNDEQKARLAAVPAAVTDRPRQTGAVVASCGGSPAAIDWSVSQIDQSVQPTDTQRGALDEMKQAFGQAATDLDAHCPTSVPLTAFGRLEAIEARLDSTYRAVLSIQVALANFETKLSDDQKVRLDNVNFAAR
jgi:hypothetical protein